MIKLYLCIAIILLSYLAGYLYTAGYEKRVRHMEGLLNRFQQIGTQMRYSFETLPELFSQVYIREEEPAGMVFAAAAENMRQNTGESFPQIWDRAVRETFTRTALTESDMETVIQLGSDLGKTDMIQQEKTLEHICGGISALLDQAKEEQKRKTKLYRTLFTAGGILIVILLI